MNETVSIIMPAYNAERTIGESIDSVLAQTYDNFKLYIVDDASLDRTGNIIRSYKDNRIVYIKNAENLGVAKSRNCAILNCTGQYIAFLDSDDIWVADKLEKQIFFLKNGWDVVCSNYSTFKIDPVDVISLRQSPEKITYKHMLKSNFIGNLTGVYNAAKLGKILQVNSGHEDYIMWLEIMKISSRAYCIQDCLAHYRVNAKSLSSNKFKTLTWQWNIYRGNLRFNFVKSIYYFVFYIYYGVLKRRT